MKNKKQKSDNFEKQNYLIKSAGNEFKNFTEALSVEQREHKSSYIIFTILRLLILLTLVRQIFLRNYEDVFFCALTLLLFIVPSIIQVSLKVEIPPTLEIITYCFIFAAEILGEINSFYIIIPFWDTILHTLNGFIAASVGFSITVILNNNKNYIFHLSPFFVCLVGICFSMTIGVLWEFLEFFLDFFFKCDAQKDTVVHSISSILLSQGKNVVVHIPDITKVTVNGQDLGINGYLDIGLIDTMKDLFVNFIGAIVFSIFGYHYVKHTGGKIVERFLLIPKTAGKDYLNRGNR